MVYRAIDFKPPSSWFPVGSMVTWNQPSSTSKSAKVVREFLRQDSALGPVSGTIYTIGSRTGRLIAEYSVFPTEEEVLMSCGSQFRVVGKASFGVKKLLEEAMECDLTDVDIVALEEVVVEFYRDLPWAMNSEEQRRNPKVMEFCTTSTQAFLLPLRANFKENGTTVLHLAAAVPENESVVQLACCQMKNEVLGVLNDNGQTALQVALGCGEGGDGAALYLARRTADLDYLQPLEKRKLLGYALSRGSAAVLKRGLKWVDEILTHKVELLELAVRTGQDEVLKLLFEVLGEVNLNSSEFSIGGQHLLHIAAGLGHFRCIAVLCEYGADVSSVDPEGRTPMFVAARFGHTHAVAELFRLKANVGQAKKDGFTPLLIASCNGHWDTVELLLQSKAEVDQAARDNTTALIGAAKNGHPDIVGLLHNHGADLEARDSGGQCALDWARRRGQVLVETLVLQKLMIKSSR